MRFYKVDDTQKARFAPTLKEAQNLARDGYSVEGEDGDPVALAFNRFDVIISEVEVPTDKLGVLVLLNTDPRECGFKVIREWELTPRGGLRESVLRLPEAEG